ncbi:afc, partial [Reticulomyxa filosa]
SNSNSKSKEKENGKMTTKNRVSAPSHDMNEGEEGTAHWKVGDTLRNDRCGCACAFVFVKIPIDVVKEYLDSGAFSTVLSCLDTKKNEIVAIKVIRSVRKYLDSAKIEIDILSDVAKHDLHHKLFSLSFFFYYYYCYYCFFFFFVPFDLIIIITTTTTITIIMDDNTHFMTKLNAQKHVCIIFEKMGCSLYQFVKKNSYRGFLLQHLQDIAKQMFEAIQCF